LEGGGNTFTLEKKKEYPQEKSVKRDESLYPTGEYVLQQLKSKGLREEGSLLK